MKKLLCLIPLLICVLLASCGEDPNRPDYDIVAKGKSAYTVIVADDAPKGAVFAAEQLVSLIAEKTGVQIPVAKASEAELSENEIVFGASAREESAAVAEGLEMEDYRIQSFGKKLVIAGGTNEALDAAVAYFAETFITEEGITVAKDYAYTYLMPVRTYTLDDSRFKPVGRTSIQGTSLGADWSGSGVEFSANCKNDVKITLTIKKISSYEAGSYFTVYVDGVRQEERFLAKEGTTELTIATGLAEGDHTFGIYKQAHNVHCLVNYDKLTVEGKLNEKPADRDLYIEFIGDSITAGYGTYSAEGTTQQYFPYSDGTQSYAFFTAEKLNADYSLLARCSWGILAVKEGENLPDVYKYICYNRNKDLYNFETARKPDVIVVNLGTNDYSKGMVNNAFKEKTVEFIADLRAKNGQDVPIVFVFGMMNNTGYAYTMKAVREAGGEANKLYTLELPKDTSGGGNHPSVEGQMKAADKLTEFIQTKVLVSSAS